MIERLEWWISTARTARPRDVSGGRSTTYGFLYETSSAYEELRERSAQTQSIIARALGRTDVPNLLRRRHTAYWVDDGIDFAEHALAVLKTRSETREKLGAVAPVMKADALHPLIWGGRGTVGIGSLCRRRATSGYGSKWASKEPNGVATNWVILIS